MAVLWQREQGGTRYEVRSAGHTRRLYANGVLHSQYNPRRPLTGNLWDLLMLPAFFLPPGRIRRVLVLGVGGGAVIRQLQHFVAPERIVGVDKDPVHLAVARRFFGVTGDGVGLIRADARAWLAAYRGPRFDMIIDDLFGDVDGEPRRAIALDEAWSRLLLRRLAPRGVLVANCVSTRELAGSALAAGPGLRGRPGSVFSLKTAQNENAVGVFLRFRAGSGDLRRRLRRDPEIAAALAGGRLRYHIRPVR